MPELNEDCPQGRSCTANGLPIRIFKLISVLISWKTVKVALYIKMVVLSNLVTLGQSFFTSQSHSSCRTLLGWWFVSHRHYRSMRHFLSDLRHSHSVDAHMPDDPIPKWVLTNILSSPTGSSVSLFFVPQTGLVRRHLMIFMRPKAFLQEGATPLFGTPWTVYETARVISLGKILWNIPPWLGIEPGPQGRQTVDNPTGLSWPWPQGGQTVSYPTELSWLELEQGRVFKNGIVKWSWGDDERSKATERSLRECVSGTIRQTKSFSVRDLHKMTRIKKGGDAACVAWQVRISAVSYSNCNSK